MRYQCVYSRGSSVCACVGHTNGKDGGVVTMLYSGALHCCCVVWRASGVLHCCVVWRASGALHCSVVSCEVALGRPERTGRTALLMQVNLFFWNFIRLFNLWTEILYRHLIIQRREGMSKCLLKGGAAPAPGRLDRLANNNTAVLSYDVVVPVKV